MLRSSYIPELLIDNMELNVIDKNNEIPSRSYGNAEISRSFHTKKNIFPEGDWDLLELLHFLSFMPIDFVASQPLKTQKQNGKYRWFDEIC